MGRGNGWSPISPTGRAVCVGKKAKHPLSRAFGVILVLCALHSILQLPKQNTSCCLVAILQGRSLHSILDQHREDLFYVCVFFYFFFSTRRMLKLTLVVVEQGRTKGRSRGMHGEGEQGTALNRSAKPVPARARRATGTPFSAITPPFCHIPYGSPTHLD